MAKLGHFKDDVVLVSDNGRVYHLSVKDLNSAYMEKRRVKNWRKNRNYKEVAGLLKLGTAAAAIPTYKKGKGGGPVPSVTCFLLNASALRKKQPSEK